METLQLNDKSVVPDDDLIFSIIGENRFHWIRLMKAIHVKYPDAEKTWNYYNDGKSWLLRMIRKKKTLFWIGILKDTFRITFYFSDKAEPVIEKSNLPGLIKADFKNGKHYGKIRGISFIVKNSGDIDNAILLAEIRAEMK